MADSKISALTGVTPLAGDEFVIARAGSNFKIDYSDLKTFITADNTIIIGTHTSEISDLNTNSINRDGSIPFTGDIILANSTPTNNLHATSKLYVDTSILGLLSKSGGTMTGSLLLNADPSVAMGATTKQYVDNAITVATTLTSTDDLTEGSVNLYWTTSRASAWLLTTTTDGLPVGTTNKYYTTSLFDTDFALKDTADLAEDPAGSLTPLVGSETLYYSHARARVAVNGITPIDYDNTTGIFSLDILDEDDFATDSNIKPATQQSIKAYVDNTLITENENKILISKGTYVVTTGVNDTDGTYAFTGITDIPSGYIIKKVYYDVITLFTDGDVNSSTISLNSIVTEDLLGALAISGISIGFADGLQTSAANKMLKTVVTTTPTLTVTLVGDATALVSGELNIYIEYIKQV